MRRPRVGTLAWARENGGALGKRDRLELLLQVVTTPLHRLAPYLRGKKRAGQGALDLADVRPPDSAIARKAEELCREASSAILVNHCQRTYLWGKILAALCEIRHDDELFYVACVLHDLGLTEAYGSGATCCFSVKSAHAAERIVEGHGWPTARREALAEAITLHMNISVDLAHGPEAHLLNAGAGLDVVGARAAEIPAALRHAVVLAHPRHGMKVGFDALLRREADLCPASRAHFLYRYLGFGLLARRAPFAD